MTTLFQQLPSVDKLLKTPQGELLINQFGHSAVVREMRNALQQARSFIQQHHSLPDFFISTEQTFIYLRQKITQTQQVKIQAVHNLTGTVLHTNLGRALWADCAQQAALQAMQHNIALEYDLSQGERSHRDQSISQLLCQLTGAEAACVVNNNAAAVLLMLATLAQGKEVIISRGELIEIGGAFRIPDIMAQAGCRLVEVGTTNRTHLRDYQRAINENTALLMKVHCSNYQICGFTKSITEQELVELGRQYNLPVITDLGSGTLIDLRQFNLPYEPTVQEKLSQGVDLVSFSGDKLLGATQAGIILGNKTLIEKLQNHPLKRVLRCDKVILAGLEASLRLYLQPEKLTQNLPTLRLLTQPVSELKIKANQLKQQLQQRLGLNAEIAVEESVAQVGSGSQPLAQIPSVAVTIAEKTFPESTAILQRFKTLPTPIIGRIEQGKIYLDLRSLADFDRLIMDLEQL